MKKRSILFLLFLISFSAISAQTLDSIAHHPLIGAEDVDVRNLMKMRDGSYLANCQYFGFENGEMFDLGNMFYKISSHGVVIEDSLFIEDHDLNRFLLKPNPFGDDYIYAKAVRDLDNRRCDLCIRFFDDDLVFDDSKEVWVPLCDTLFRPLWDTYYLDEAGDIIMHFPIVSRDEEHFFRIGIDGTMKDHVVEPFSSITPINASQCTDNMGTYSDHPKEYYYWGFHMEFQQLSFHAAILDSLLHVKEVLTPVGGNEFHYGYQDYLLNWDEHTFLIASRWRQGGVRVSRYDKETLEVIKTVCFSEGDGRTSRPIGIDKSYDGGIYFSYAIGDFDDDGQVVVMKLDYDLNVVWQRHCLEPEGYCHEGTRMTASEDGTLAVAGYNVTYPLEFFFLSFTDNEWKVNENTMPFRPYAFRPNPVVDELRMEFSPDVTPSRVELYDLNGRLLRTWRNGLETIDMADLSAGTYTLKVTLTDGKTYSDKVVKK